MPISESQEAALNAALAAQAQAFNVVVGLVEALVPDTDPHPLQVALDAMTEERDELAQSLQTATADLSSVVDERNALQAKIDASKAHIQASVTADAAEDASRNAALQALE